MEETRQVASLAAKEARKMPPKFDPKKAQGKAKDWNAPDNVPRDSETSSLWWERLARDYFADLPETQANICTILNFLNHMSRSDGKRSVLALLGSLDFASSTGELANGSICVSA